MSRGVSLGHLEVKNKIKDQTKNPVISNRQSLKYQVAKLEFDESNQFLCPCTNTYVLCPCTNTYVHCSCTNTY